MEKVKGLNQDIIEEGMPRELQRGFLYFLNCKIDLSKKIFIPRIETEFWVKKAIKEIKKRGSCRRLIERKRKLEILDIFAGSGCIGIAILKNIPEFCQRVDFVDIDECALSQIKINLKKNKIPKEQYRIFKSDIFENLRKNRYDYIFANPPYVAKNRISEVEKSVLKYEPKRALFGRKDGLFYIRRFLKEAEGFLKRNGIIYLEFDPEQKEEIKKILKKCNYQNFSFFKDQFKKYRWLKILKVANPIRIRSVPSTGGAWY